MKFMKKALAATMALTLTLSLAACGGQKTAETNDTPDAETRTEYKVGIIQLMDHASLNQIADNIESRLDELGEELLKLTQEVACGKQTKAESLGYPEMAIARVCNFV